MPAPIVSWYTSDNSSQVTQWDIGTVDAGSLSTTFTVLIWNNRGGSTAVSDMQNCTLTTKDSSGGNTGELVTNTWIEVKVDSLSESSFTAVGGTVTKDIRATKSDTPAKTIKGPANDGNVNTANTTANFSKVTLRANVPPTATAGLVTFLTRVSYQYV
ncbi:MULTISPECIES: hypothetical protein [unclassified Paenibacillus]|jgi:hypothetical protein|uniref:hypothetical protein n=1 Tax=unclassified Paenibacillus TaxID=185978 RepID=UPI0004653970|nr:MULTISPECIES: hypothetical protein [unclassified Paenibacillus]KGP82425.1 hypothetical protein P364_0112005 [Paenibacillus sp. MAEPY2]KGP89283.1 hypothetical protein P363_0102980 [Paenibacillus sp. MAEPY1]SEL28452.1 hypothetical protein SAMN05518856_109136 [Paenibacillus sp. OK003]